MSSEQTNCSSGVGPAGAVSDLAGSSGEPVQLFSSCSGGSGELAQLPANPPLQQTQFDYIGTHKAFPE